MDERRPCKGLAGCGLYARVGICVLNFAVLNMLVTQGWYPVNFSGGLDKTLPTPGE